jgi:hypothetical protein
MNPQPHTPALCRKAMDTLANRISDTYYATMPMFERDPDGTLWLEIGDDCVNVNILRESIKDFESREDEITALRFERERLIKERKELVEYFDANFLGPKNAFKWKQN